MRVGGIALANMDILLFYAERPPWLTQRELNDEA